MELALKILAVALVLVLGWLLTTKGLPRLVVFVGRRDLGIAFAVLIAFHYATSWSRLEWLIQQ